MKRRGGKRPVSIFRIKRKPAHRASCPLRMSTSRSLLRRKCDFRNTAPLAPVSPAVPRPAVQSRARSRLHHPRPVSPGFARTTRVQSRPQPRARSSRLIHGAAFGLACTTRTRSRLQPVSPAAPRSVFRSHPRRCIRSRPRRRARPRTRSLTRSRGQPLAHGAAWPLAAFGNGRATVSQKLRDATADGRQSGVP